MSVSHTSTFPVRVEPYIPPGESFITLGKINERRVKELAIHKSTLHSGYTQGATPLHEAAARDNESLVQFLIEQGADVDASMEFRLTPLHLAVAAGALETVNVLLANNADCDLPADGGLTPLHLATIMDQDKIAELLVTSGAEISAHDVRGRTPLWYAKKNNNKKLIMLFRKSTK